MRGRGPDALERYQSAVREMQRLENEYEGLSIRIQDLDGKRDHTAAAMHVAKDAETAALESLRRALIYDGLLVEQTNLQSDRF